MTTTNTNASASSNQGNGDNYVNMLVAGLGYLSRVRQVQPRKGSPFVSCSIAGFHGEKGVKDGMTFVNYDVKAASAQATEILSRFWDQANDPKVKVLVRFRIGDIYIDSFTRTKGERAGETALVLKGRLLFVSHVWVKSSDAEGADYELAYKYEEPAQPEQEQPEEQKDGTNG